MIRNKYELKEAKKRLRQREADAKGKIVSNWKALKSSLRPKSLLAGQFDHKPPSENGEDSLLVNIFSYSAALLGRRLGEIAEEKLGEMFKKEE
jgi:hypothetical protein